jgi:hypothetical protein
MLDFLIDSIFVSFGGALFQQDRVEKSKVLMEDILEKDLDFRLSKRSLEFFKIHM